MGKWFVLYLNFFNKINLSTFLFEKIFFNVIFEPFVIKKTAMLKISFLNQGSAWNGNKVNYTKSRVRLVLKMMNNVLFLATKSNVPFPLGQTKIKVHLSHCVVLNPFPDSQ